MNAFRMRMLKSVLFLLALLPFLRLVWGVWADQLGANPVEFITRNSGDWCLYLLCITLGITPLRQLSGWNWLVQLRRMLGLYVFFYGLLHFSAFFWFDHRFEWDEMWRDVGKRPFILVGFSAFLLLLPLALTSNRFSIRKLGRRWQQLHRLVYLIAVLGVLHFWWMKAGKHDFAQPALFGLIVGVLFAWRLWHAARARWQRAAAQA